MNNPYGEPFTECMCITEDGQFLVETVDAFTGKVRYWTLGAWLNSEKKLRSAYGTCWREVSKVNIKQ